jgi:hypothetical protein
MLPMKSNRYWDGVERRKARPSRDGIIDLLNRFGTEYPEPEKKAAELRDAYYELLARPWPQRGKGLTHTALIAIVASAASAVFFLGGSLLFALWRHGPAGIRGWNPVLSLAIFAWGPTVFGMALFILSKLTINKRTKVHAFRKFPAVRRAALQLADSSANETARDYLPVLHIHGRVFFQLVFVRKGDAARTPTGILILDGQGLAVFRYGALEATKLTASISITCGHVLQNRSADTRRSMRNVVEQQIPQAVRVLTRQERQFAEHGLSPRWASVMEGAALLPPALKESITILDAEEAFRKSMGYEFAREFYYEDAAKLRELYISYVRYLNAAFRRNVISLTTETAMLIQIIKPKTDWQEKEAALSALSTLAVAGTNGVLSRICQKEFEGIATEADRRAYEKKTQQAKKFGWPFETKEESGINP